MSGRTLTAICNGLRPDGDPSVLWTDGTGIAACGRADLHGPHSFTYMKAVKPNYVCRYCSRPMSEHTLPCDCPDRLHCKAPLPHPACMTCNSCLSQNPAECIGVLPRASASEDKAK